MLSLTRLPPTMQHLSFMLLLLSMQHLLFMLLLLFTLPLWSTVLQFTIPQLQLLSMLPPCTVALGKCPTSQYPSLTRASTGPPPSPRPSEPPLLLSTTPPVPSTEPTVGVL